MQFWAFMYYAMKNCSLLLLRKKPPAFLGAQWGAQWIHLSAYSVVLLASNFASYSEPYCNLQTNWKPYNVLLNLIWEQVKRENREIVFILLQYWLSHEYNTHNCDQIDHKTLYFQVQTIFRWFFLSWWESMCSWKISLKDHLTFTPNWLQIGKQAFKMIICEVYVSQRNTEVNVKTIWTYCCFIWRGERFSHMALEGINIP